MTLLLEDKLRRLRELLHDMGRILVAYSGGVDSALVLAVAREQLGRRDALGCIAVSPSYPRRELRDAVRLARRLEARIRIVRTDEHADADYAANRADRCYFCKTRLYQRLQRIAAEEGWAAVVNGTHADDLPDHRHGIAAATQHGVRSPLLEAALSKAEVRGLARALGVPSWAKPATACMASRVPHGTPITPELLARIERAEDVLVALGFAQFRVRHHGEVARIEVPESDLARAIDCRAPIVDGLRRVGYRHVTLDLTGFRREPELENREALVPLTVRDGSNLLRIPASRQR